MLFGRKIFLLTLTFCLLVPGRFAFAQLFPGRQATAPIHQIPLLITWRTQSLTPNWYQGRVLPTRGSKTTAYVQGLENGKSVDLSRYAITWSVNGTPWTNGLGKTTFDFTVSQFAPSSYNLTVTLKDTEQIAGQATVTMPIATPKITLDIPYPGKVLPKQDAVVEALLYFFSAQNDANLELSWSIKSTPIPQAQVFGNIITVSFDAGGDNIPLVVSAQNDQNPAEKAQTITHISIR